MSVRRPLQPLSPLAANVAGPRNTHLFNNGVNGDNADDNDTQGSGSAASGLTDLETDPNAADDDFERLMLQNARDEQRLKNTLRGHVQPFRNARAHPRVGLTMENLERSQAHGGRGGRVGLPSPASSSGASDPAPRPPVQWGRKARVRKNWMRDIVADADQTPGAQEHVVQQNVQQNVPDTTPRPHEHDADRPRQSVEDSPLSHKSSMYGTPRRNDLGSDGEPDWDLDIDFNEASMIASTPYVQRNTALDDIHQRETDSLQEQAVAGRLDQFRESPSEVRRRPRASELWTRQPKAPSPIPEQAVAIPPEETRRSSAPSQSSEQATRGVGPAEVRRRRSPLLVRKSTETVGVVDPGLAANALTNPPSPVRNREDSHNLLRRLARVSSNTPSPGSRAASRPQTAPARQQGEHKSQTTAETEQPGEKSTSASDSQKVQIPQEIPTKEPSSHTSPLKDPPRRRSSVPAPASEPIQQPITSDGIDATPMPTERTILNPKTPVVTGAWIDTPRPVTARRTSENSSQPAQRSPQQSGPSGSSQSSGKGKGREPPTQEQIKRTQPVVARPNLPRSALEAVVEEAKANRSTPRHEDRYGDSTIDSLEDLITPGANQNPSDQDEDTLEGLDLPTGAPRNEAERLRQDEIAQIHKMGERLRTARTSMRDVSRGLRRVEHQVEHIEEGGEAVRIVYRDCPCAANGHNCAPWAIAWKNFKRLFYKSELGRTGLTWLSIGLISFLVWWVSEEVACDQYCHKRFRKTMIGFGVDPNAPRYPFVIPTLIYRNLLLPWRFVWEPMWDIVYGSWSMTWFILSCLWAAAWVTVSNIWGFAVWLLATVCSSLFGGWDSETKHSATVTASKATRTILHTMRAGMRETYEPDSDSAYRMDDDEFIY